EAMFFDALEKVPRGLIACVFDGTDRLQHTFWRDIDDAHPAHPGDDVLGGRHVIEDLYRRMDDLVGRTWEKCRRNDELLIVLSDHGFGPFRSGIDWSRTRAFAIGLAGIYINVKERFGQGIVAPGAETDRLREEIAERLTAL